MTKIKLCGLSRPQDIEIVNEIKPEYIGFVFWKKSKRYVSEDTATGLKEMLSEAIKAVGVFIDEPVENVAKLLNDGIIDIAQLHGSEDEEYISSLRRLSDKEIIKAFLIEKAKDLEPVKKCSADYILLDAGIGSGKVFDWSILQDINRPYFLAGGLNLENVQDAIRLVKPFAVDVSSGIETDGIKDEAKMRKFVDIVRR